MVGTWIHLRCTACGEEWEAMPAALPTPDAGFDCPYCGSRSPAESFIRTANGLDALEEFHRE